MPLGGGTFSANEEKITPGVYANFSNISNSQYQSARGVVAFLVPVTDNELDIKEVTLSNYRTEVGAYSCEDFYTPENLITCVREILYNANMVYMAPIVAIKDGDDYVYNFDGASLDEYDFNVLLHVDLKDDGFVEEEIDRYFSSYFTKTYRRFMIVSSTDLNNIDTEYKKWYVVPYNIHTSYYIAGAIAGVDIGDSLSGAIYKGTYTKESMIPPSFDDQEEALKEGKFLFYRLGNTFRILKDITLAAGDENESYNNKTGQIVRLEKFIYDYFVELYANQIQGYPNSERNRKIIKGEILRYFYSLEEENILENVQPEDISVEMGPTKDSILIKMRYCPVSGINYIYLIIEVD